MQNITLAFTAQTHAIFHVIRTHYFDFKHLIDYSREIRKFSNFRTLF